MRPPPPAGEFAPSFRWEGGGSGVREPGGAERLGQPDTGSATAAPRFLAAGCHLRSSEIFLPHRRLFATKTMSAACRHLSGAALGRFTPDTCEYLPSARTPCFRPQPFQVTVWGRSCPFATPGSRCRWQFGKGSQPLPGRARAKLPARAPARRAGGLRRAFTPACPRGAAPTASRRRLLLPGPGRSAQDGSAPSAK